MRSCLRPAAALALVAALAGCGSSGDSASTTTVGCKEAQGGSVTLVADDLRWDTDCLQAAAGPLTIVVDNEDGGVNHNLHLPEAPDSPSTELEPGPVTQELDVTLTPGSYEYLCDLHPNMVGTLTVS
jgi:plastocyanin